MNRKIRNEKVRKRSARRARVAKSVRDTRRPRLTVYRSARHIYAQIIDPNTGHTLLGVSTRSRDVTGDAGSGNVDAAKRVGKALAERAREKDIAKVVFNRNGFLYHGRVKALAEAAREAGLEF